MTGKHGIQRRVSTDSPSLACHALALEPYRTTQLTALCSLTPSDPGPVGDFGPATIRSCRAHETRALGLGSREGWRWREKGCVCILFFSGGSCCSLQQKPCDAFLVGSGILMKVAELVVELVYLGLRMRPRPHQDSWLSNVPFPDNPSLVPLKSDNYHSSGVPGPLSCMAYLHTLGWFQGSM